MRKSILFTILLSFTSASFAADKKPQPPRPGLFEKSKTSCFFYNGVKFNSIQEWRRSQSYKDLQDFHRMYEHVDAKLDIINAQSDKIIGGFDNQVLKQYNSNRTFYQLNHLTKEYRDGAKRTMSGK